VAQDYISFLACLSPCRFEQVSIVRIQQLRLQPQKFHLLEISIPEPTMNSSVFFLYLFNFSMIGALPIIFFKKGEKNPRWWLTAAPFFLCIGFLTLSYAEIVPSLYPQASWQMQADIIATALASTSISLISYTIGTHRISLNLWHQEQDQPHHIVTYGPYEKIRHPFYTSFILSLTGAFIFCPHWVTLLTLVSGIIALQITAVKEEKKITKPRPRL
jgi:protein-S-isoprenylcysteine O-methyltransferase Ste14